MSFSLPQEPKRINTDMYKSLTPTKRRTFSENMTRRRIPFLLSENDQTYSPKATVSDKMVSTSTCAKLNNKENKNNLKSNTKLFPDSRKMKIQKNTINNSSQDNLFNTNRNGIERKYTTHYSSKEEKKNFEYFFGQKNKLNHPEIGIDEVETETRKIQQNTSTYKTTIQIKQNENKIKQPTTGFLETETQLKMPLREITISKYSELSQTSGYYSEESINETHTNLENSFKFTKPSISSTLICKEEESVIGRNVYEIDTNETNGNETNLLTLNSNFICPTDTSGNDINEYQTAESSSILENTGESFGNGTIKKKIIHKNEKRDAKVSYKQNSLQIPLIVINGIELINDRSETLIVSKYPRHSEFEENKKLIKKITEMEHFKQIEIKDKVMAQLLENANSLDFPKLKHICSSKCEKTEDGCCMKLQLKQQEESSGFFQILWSAIKYPFVANPSTTEKIDEKGEGQKDNENDSKEEETKKEIKITNEENKKQEFKADSEENKQKNQEEISKNIQLKETLDIKETINEKTIKDEDTIDVKMQKNETIENVLKVIGKVLAREDKEEDNLQDEKNVLKDDANNPQNIAEKDENKNRNLEDTNKSNKQTIKEEVEKKSTAKKKFLFFFHKTDTTSQTEKKQEVKDNTKVSDTEDLNKIENMEEKFEEMEKAENKLEIKKMAEISKDSLTKLQQFMTEKNKEESMQIKAKSKRSDSF